MYRINYRKSMKSFYLSKLVLGILLVAALLGCDENKNGGSNPDPDPSIDLTQQRKDIAAQIADHYILPAYEELHQSLDDLSASFAIFEEDQSEQNLGTLRDLLKVTWLSWQKASLFQIGPAESNAIRVVLNVYPTDVDKIESNIVDQGYTLGTIENRDAVGFPALDYLLNHDLAVPPYDENTLQYIEDVIDHAASTVSLVKDDFENGSYLDNFVSDQASGTDVGSALGQMVNSIDNHFQRYVRDGKLAIPAGIRSAGIPRPTTTEAYYGGYSLELLSRALESYQSLFEGTGYDGVQGPGILDYLRSIDQADLATDISTQIQRCIDDMDKLTDPLSTHVEQSTESAEMVFLTLQEFVTLVKSDMASVMGITITNQDNDGD